MAQPKATNVPAALARIAAPWQPHRLASINDYELKVVKLEGEFVWHSHVDTDELFYVLSGRLTINMREASVELGPGDVYVVPKGVEHRPHAHGLVEALLFEPRGVVNTGDAGGEMTSQLKELE